jgi:hypothetical protein
MPSGEEESSWFSGLVLHAAATADDQFSAALLGVIGVDLDALSAAVDVEWTARTKGHQDQPVTLVNQAFQAVAAAALPDAQLNLASLLVEIVAYPDSMATRVMRRVGADPNRVAEKLRGMTQ